MFSTFLGHSLRHLAAPAEICYNEATQKGGMSMNASSFRAIARSALRGKWPISILITLVATLLGAKSAGNIKSDFSIEKEIENLNSASLETFLQDPIGQVIAVIAGAIAFTAVLIGIVVFIIGAATELGLKLYNLRLISRIDNSPFLTLFERFSIFGRALGLRLYMALFIFLWSLLFVIPGIIAAYRYAMAPYLMAQYPEMGIREAVERSKKMMAGNKGRLFCLHISFIGWMILASIPAGLGYIILNPYMNAAEAAFYLDLTRQLPLNSSYEY